MVYTNEEMIEAIEVLESAKQHGCRVRDDVIDIAEQVINKQISKKPICKIYESENIYLGTSKNYYCPTCNNGLIWYDDNHCKDCGQAIDWSEV